FCLDHLIQPRNGPASAELAKAVEADLLQKESYNSYGIDLDAFFSRGGPRMWADLFGLSDRTWGWNSRYAKLRAAAYEGIAAHPMPYIKGSVRTFAESLVLHYKPETLSARHHGKSEGKARLNKNGLPAPTEGQLIPKSYLWWLATSPDNTISEELESRTNSQVRAMNAKLPVRDGSPAVSFILNEGVGAIYPPVFTWLCAGVFLFV